MLASRLTRRQTLLSLACCGSAVLFGVGARSQPRDQQRELPKDILRWRVLPDTPKLPQAFRQGLLPINGVQIFFAQFGEGPSVLLLHGGLANSHYWGAQIDELSKSFRVTVMDTRGQGRSPLTSGALSYKLFASDVVELLKALDISKTAVVGWSDGAITGIQLAVRSGELISGLFAFGANTSLDGLIAGGAASPIFRKFSSRARNEYASLSPHPENWPELTRALGKMWRTEPNFSKKELAEIGCPVVVSDGEHDEIIRPEHTRQIAARIPGARLVIQRNVSHFAMLQDPSQFNSALSTFLSESL
jgi:pimeloyl-ACP methyl ester carboxylesterase